MALRVEDLAQKIFDMLDDRGCFNGIDADIQVEILEAIGDEIEKFFTAPGESIGVYTSPGEKLDVKTEKSD